MLQDRSLDNSTQLFGPAAMPFKPGHPHRRVLVDQNINLLFGIGGAACDLYQFEIHWHGRYESMVRQCIDTRLGNPSHARTISYEPPTSVSCLPFGRIRYSKRERLRSGTFGEVWKVANADTGAQLAVKRIKTPRSDSYQSFSLKREVDMLSRVSHTNIIKYITSQSADDGHFDIFMKLKSGSVQSLITEDQLFARSIDSAYSLLFQMLQALDCLANVGMIHRDVKPENILFTPLSDGQYLYQLADFGLANLAVNAQTYAGTKPYMAPEVYQGSRQPQTVKMDIWSLFVTLAYAMNAAGFRRKPRHSREQVFKAVWEAANWVRLRQFREMAIEDPDYRATAGDMLDKAFFGEGRTTS
ncbi:hypothetical protein NW767_000198 [Fusarium falciforme]|nr:hypothetical protein NW767_000198 [Fusarium falciforme]